MEAQEKKLIRDQWSEEILQIAEQIVLQEGAHTVTVRKIMEKMGKSNRVFYNRFHNCDEVLHCVYESIVLRMRSRFAVETDTPEALSRSAMELAIGVLTDTYDIKQQFSHYMFEHDSMSERNRQWWMQSIRTVLERAQARGYLNEKLELDAICHAVWCFCRGFNADVVGGRYEKEDAIALLKTEFGYLLAGMLKLA